MTASLPNAPRLAARARRLTLALLTAAVTLHPSPALAQTDSIPKPPEPLFTATDAAYAAGFLVAAAAMAPLDLVIAHELRDSTAQSNQFLQKSATGFRLLGNPGVAVVTSGMFLVGRAVHSPDLADVGLHASEALITAIAITDVFKTLAGRARPSQDPEHPYDFKLGRGWRNGRYASFPSGHTTAAFATAAALSSELSRLFPDQKWFVRPILYGSAGLVGISRLYNNDHWASDVVVGAAIGSFAGWKVVRFNHTHPHNRLDRWLLSASILPAPDGSVRLAWTITPDF